MTDDDPPLLIYQQTANHLLLNPRPGPRHALRADPYPRRPSHAMTHPDDQARDVGDEIDPAAEDPTGDEITDPDHPDYVSPYFPESEAR